MIQSYHQSTIFCLSGKIKGISLQMKSTMLASTLHKLDYQAHRQEPGSSPNGLRSIH